MNEIEAKIEAYRQKCGFPYLDIDSLIVSNEYLRTTNQEKQTEWLKALENARQRAYQQVLDSNWIRIEDLKKMKVCDLVNLLQDD